jgi:hypothetical protein
MTEELTEAEAQALQDKQDAIIQGYQDKRDEAAGVQSGGDTSNTQESPSNTN